MRTATLEDLQAVTAVESACFPSCRRQGYVGKLMQAAMDAARHQMRLTF
ncbi:hypothetical protein [Megasphaera sp.]|nr:hypothetical protein [Megasphaera sp.]